MQIRHVVERGSVHLFIVASKEIEEEEEIILSLDTAICAPQTTKSVTAKTTILESPVKEENVEPVKVKEEKVPVSPPPVITSPVRKNGTIARYEKKIIENF